ncbi:MAG: hypothetical protein ABR569_09840 [Gaiellaceae bacterium]
MSANRLRWDGRPGWFEAWYITVAGRFWLRYSLLVPSDPERKGEAALWLACFIGEPTVRKTTFDLAALSTGPGGFPLELGPGRLTDTEAVGDGWELRLGGPERPFLHAPPLARALHLSQTQVAVAKPALELSGVVDGHKLERALGQQAHVWGTRHTRGWGFAHATVAPGRWVEALTVKLPRLPWLSFHATERGRSRLRLGGPAQPGSWCIGPYTLEAAQADFVGVTYLDPDGTPAYCWHTERARLYGPGLELDGVALEHGARAKLEGWPVSI